MLIEGYRGLVGVVCKGKGGRKAVRVKLFHDYGMLIIDVKGTEVLLGSSARLGVEKQERLNCFMI